VTDIVGWLLIRAWHHDGVLMARVTRTPDVAAMAPRSVVVATRDALHREVEQWLDDLSQSDLG